MVESKVTNEECGAW